MQSGDFENHEASFGHEALAGAASFGAFKLFEDRQRKEGKFFLRGYIPFPFLIII